MSHNYESTTYNPPISPEERQRREMNNAINRAISQADQRHQEEVIRIQQQHAQDRQALQQRLNALNSQYQQTILVHQQRLDNLRANFDSQLQQTIEQQDAARQQLKEQLDRQQKIAIDAVLKRINNLQKDTQQAITVVNQNIQTLQTQTQQALQVQQQQIDNIVAGIQQDKAQAAATKQALREAYNDQLSIVSQKNHAKYAPNQLQAIQNQLNGINALPDAAACAILSQCFNSLLTLDANIEQAKAEYEARHLITLRTVEEILARMHENRMVPLTNGDNQEVRNERGEIVRIELDFWTDGEYGELERELETIRDEIVKGLNDPTYSSDDLDRALNRALEINTRQSELVIGAIERGNASQVRAEMADSIADHLMGQTFRVVERGYEDHDARKAYIIKLEDGSSKIVVIINPQGNKANQVVIGTVETDLQEPELIRQGQEINEILREEIEVETKGETCAPLNAQVDRALRAIYDGDVIRQGIPQDTRNNANLSSMDQERHA